MIISRTPFRISFLGGGSDLPGFYAKSKGAVLSVAINKYMYISVHPFFNRKKIQLKYSKTELCSSLDEINHPIFREVLRYLNLKEGLEIVSSADVPSGTGLGSSSSFTVGLLNSLYSYKGEYVLKSRLASEASMIEIEKLGEPIGKQDQYASAFGGMNIINFNLDGSVDVNPISLKQSILKKLEKNLLLFYTNISRRAGDILVQQRENIKSEKKFSIQKKMVELVWEAREALYQGKLQSFGELLNKGWQLKKSLTDKISNSIIDNYYSIALENGAIGGKLLGAGGGGFLLLYCEKENQEDLRKALCDLYELKFSFDWQGSNIIYDDGRGQENNTGFFE